MRYLCISDRPNRQPAIKLGLASPESWLRIDRDRRSTQSTEVASESFTPPNRTVSSNFGTPAFESFWISLDLFGSLWISLDLFGSFSPLLASSSQALNSLLLMSIYKSDYIFRDFADQRFLVAEPRFELKPEVLNLSSTISDSLRSSSEPERPASHDWLTDQLKN